MAKVLEDAAWKELSGDFAWNEQLLEKYKDKVEWKTVSGNRPILRTVSMLEKFKNRIDWEELSGSNNEHLFTAENLEKYKNYWNWRELSRNSDLILTSELLEQFADCWDWNEIIDCYGRGGLFSAGVFGKNKNPNSPSSFQSSRFWGKMGWG